MVIRGPGHEAEGCVCALHLAGQLLPPSLAPALGGFFLCTGLLVLGALLLQVTPSLRAAPHTWGPSQSWGPSCFADQTRPCEQFLGCPMRNLTADSHLGCFGRCHLHFLG